MKAKEEEKSIAAPTPSARVAAVLEYEKNLLRLCSAQIFFKFV